MHRISRIVSTGAVFCALAVLAGCQAQASKPVVPPPPSQAQLVARGEYLIRTTGCNDCHTVGYGESEGQLPVSQWLTGSPMGYNGPWGTTYAANLRLRLQDMSEAQWMEYSAHLRTRPVMPDFAVRAMNPEDRRAMYHFIRSLGPAGAPAPAYLPPGETPPPPYFSLVLPAESAAKH